MRVTANVNNTTIVHNNTVVNNTTNNITNVKNVTNITNVTIVAPASATANGQAVNSSVPAQAHLAAAQTAVVKAQAPEPASTKPVPAFVHGRPPAPLPPAQAVNTAPSGPAPVHANTPKPANQSHTGNAASNGSNGQPASANKPPVAGNPKGNQPQEAGNSKGNQPKGGKPQQDHGSNGTVAGQPKQNAADHIAPSQNGAHHDANKPGSPQVAANGGSKAGDGKHPNAGTPPAKNQSVATTAKNKDHPKKQSNKDEKQDHDKPT
jgi:hypothetical protein